MAALAAHTHQNGGDHRRLGKDLSADSIAWETNVRSMRRELSSWRTNQVLSLNPGLKRTSDNEASVSRTRAGSAQAMRSMPAVSSFCESKLA